MAIKVWRRVKLHLRFGLLVQGSDVPHHKEQLCLELVNRVRQCVDALKGPSRAPQPACFLVGGPRHGIQGSHHVAAGVSQWHGLRPRLHVFLRHDHQVLEGVVHRILELLGELVCSVLWLNLALTALRTPLRNTACCLPWHVRAW